MLCQRQGWEQQELQQLGERQGGEAALRQGGDQAQPQLRHQLCPGQAGRCGARLQQAQAIPCQGDQGDTTHCSYSTYLHCCQSESRSTLGAPVLSLPSLTSNSTVAKVKTGPSGGAGAGPASQGEWPQYGTRGVTCMYVTCATPGPAELSTTAKKRMKLIKQQAADMSSISKKKSSK